MIRAQKEDARTSVTKMIVDLPGAALATALGKSSTPSMYQGLACLPSVLPACWLQKQGLGVAG